MNDSDLTGPSRFGWQLIWLIVLVVLVAVYAVVPLAMERATPIKVINWADLPEGTTCSCPAAKVEMLP